MLKFLFTPLIYTINYQDKYVANAVHKKYGISNHVDILDKLKKPL